MRDYQFIPISVETFGNWGEIELKFVKKVGSLIADKTHEKRSTSFLFQALSIALQRGNYLAITGTLGETDACMEEISFL